MEIQKFENLTDLTDVTETRDQLQVFSRKQNKCENLRKLFDSREKIRNVNGLL